MSNYNLTDNVQEDWPFDIREKKYRMRYPRTEEVEKIQEFNQKLDEATNNKNTEEAERVTKDLTNYIYGLITPEGHQTPIDEALRAENIKVMQRFNAMIRAELSV